MKLLQLYFKDESAKFGCSYITYDAGEDVQLDNLVLEKIESRKFIVVIRNQDEFGEILNIIRANEYDSSSGIQVVSSSNIDEYFRQSSHYGHEIIHFNTLKQTVQFLNFTANFYEEDMPEYISYFYHKLRFDLLMLGIDNFRKINYREKEMAVKILKGEMKADFAVSNFQLNNWILAFTSVCIRVTAAFVLMMLPGKISESEDKIVNTVKAYRNPLIMNKLLMYFVWNIK